MIENYTYLCGKFQNMDCSFYTEAVAAMNLGRIKYQDAYVSQVFKYNLSDFSKYWDELKQKVHIMNPTQILKLHKNYSKTKFDKKVKKAFKTFP